MKSISCIIESPKGSTGKFDIDPKTGSYKLSKTLPAGLVFPFDFGFIPGTVGEDGDPLGVIIISETTAFTGCAMDCRIIGAIKARQTERDGDEMRNDRYIAIPEVSVLYKQIERMSQLPKQMIQEVERFFINYNDQAGKQFKPLELTSGAEAWKQIQKAQEDAAPTNLIRLLLPRYNSDGKPFPESYFTAVKEKLAEKFGGVTIYAQSPASGLWKDKGDKTVADQLIAFEVMVSDIDAGFWKQYKASLQKKFAQDEIMIRRSEIELL